MARENRRAIDCPATSSPGGLILPGQPKAVRTAPSALLAAEVQMTELVTGIASIVAKAEGAAQDWLDRYSLPLLRISMGAIIFGFGFLKYFPGISPAEHMVLTVNHTLTFGMMPHGVTLPLFATVEC